MEVFGQCFLGLGTRGLSTNLLKYESTSYLKEERNDTWKNVNQYNFKVGVQELTILSERSCILAVCVWYLYVFINDCKVKLIHNYTFR